MYTVVLEHEDVPSFHRDLQAASAPLHTVRSPRLPGPGAQPEVPAGRHQTTAPQKSHKRGRWRARAASLVSTTRARPSSIVSILTREGPRLGRQKWGFLVSCLGVTARTTTLARTHADGCAAFLLQDRRAWATNRCRQGASGILVVRYRPGGDWNSFLFEALRGRIR